MSFVAFCTRVLALALTLGQLVFSHVLFDLVAPALLDGGQRAIAEEMFGKLFDAIPEGARRTRVAVCGRNSGKTTLAAARGLFRMLTADVSSAGPGDVPVVVAIAPDMKTARILLRRALELAKQAPDVAPYIESETSDGFTIRRPHDGVLVAFEVFAASRGGASIRGRSILEALLDEAAFFFDDTYAANAEDIYRAAIGRLMPGGTIWLFSTPWAESGLFFDLFEKNFAKPTRALVARAATLVMRDNDATIAADVAAELERDPVNAEREFGAQFISAGSSLFFDAKAIDACVDDRLTMPTTYDPTAWRAAGGDFGFESDSSALVIGQSKNGRAWVAHIEEDRPQKGFPLKPSAVVGKYSASIHRFNDPTLLVDKHYFQAINEHAENNRVRIAAGPGGMQGNLEVHLAARDLINDRRIVLPRHPRLISQLKAVTSRPMPGGGLKVSSPRRRGGGGHGDIASAFVLMAWAINGATAGTNAVNRQREHARQACLQVALVDTIHGSPEHLRLLGEINGTGAKSVWELMNEARERGERGETAPLRRGIWDEVNGTKIVA